MVVLSGKQPQRAALQSMPRAALLITMLTLLFTGLAAGCTRAATAGPVVPSIPATSAPTTRPNPPSPGPSPPSHHAGPARPPPAVSTPRPARSSTAAAAPTALSPAARAAGLIDIRTIIPDAIVDLRYATSQNFVGVVLYPASARCLVHQSMAAGLTVAADRLRRQGDLLVFWDCYRPHEVQVHMFQIVPDSNWVARPGPYATSHESGRSVDITVAHASTTVACAAAERVHGHCRFDMGTGFDDFTARAHAFAGYGVSQLAQSNRALLRSALNAGGLTVYSGEWWHFDGPGADIERPILGAPLS